MLPRKLDTFSHAVPAMQEEEEAARMDEALRARWRGSDTIDRTDGCRFPRSNRRFWQFRRVARSVLANSRDPRQATRNTLRVMRFIVVREGNHMSDHAEPVSQQSLRPHRERRDTAG